MTVIDARPPAVNIYGLRGGVATVTADLSASLNGVVVAWLVGGTVDDATGAATVNGVTVNGVTTWDIPVPTDDPVPLRLTLDDVPASVGWLIPSTVGRTGATDMTVALQDVTLDLTVTVVALPETIFGGP